MTALARACERIGRELRTSLVVPAGVSGTDVETARRIAAASHVRFREVLLRGPWWQRAGEPLLGTLYGGPVALIPRGSHFICYRPDTETTVRVDASLAARISPQAVAFTAPATADDRPVALARHAVRGTGMDAVRLLAAAAAAALAGLAVPLLSGRVVSSLTDGGVPTPAGALVIVLIAIAVAIAAFELVGVISLIRIEARLELSLETAIMDRLLRLPAGFFRAYSAGDLAQRVLGVSQVRHVVAGTLPMAVVSAAAGVANLFLIFAYDVVLGLVALGLGALAVLSIALIARESYRRSRAIAEADGRLAALGLQLVSGIARIRIAGAQRRAFELWMQRVVTLRDTTWHGAMLDAVMGSVVVAFPILATLSFFVVVTLPGRAGALDAGTLTVVLVAAQMFLASVLQLGAALVGATQVLPVLERAAPILAATPERRPAAAAPGKLEGTIEARDIAFRYSPDGPLVLDGVSVAARPGEMVALAGASGSGKSTLLRVLLGLETPERGGVFVDGVDLAGLDAGEVRRQMGIVLQHGRLFSGTLMSNITGLTGGGQAEAWAAARLAALDEDIRAMPMGMHTLINEGATTLSGGQRQRLLLARALASKPRILLLDEATSALDSRTQERVAAALGGLGLTRLIVAHRLSTVRHADRIHVLRHGRVVETGTYDELLSRPGEFARLARSSGAAEPAASVAPQVSQH